MPKDMIENAEGSDAPRDVWRGMLRGFRLRCPNCGEGRLFRSFLKVADHCSECGEEFHPHRADDFPAYLVIIVVGHAIVRDEPTQVTAVIRKGCDDPAVEAFILTGGTGVTSRDSTFEAVEALLDKRLTGFGELFRMLSYQEVGAAAMLSRAQGGVVRGRALFSLPGSPNACRLALEKLILPELGHVLREVRR